MKSKFMLLLASLALLTAGDLMAKGEADIWKKYKAAERKGETSQLLNFSYAGYRHAEVGVPDVEHTVFNVQDYGAVPNDQFSDREALLLAIEAAEANGSGVIYFPKGRYVFNTKADPCEPIVIKGSNIVLRGEGSGVDGTEIFMQQPFRAPNPVEKWTAPVLITFNGKGYNEKLADVVADSPKGTYSITVDKAPKSLKAGDWVTLRMNNNDPKVIARDLAPHSVGADWSNMLYLGLQIYDYHQVVAIKGNKITFKEPLMREVRQDEGWYLQDFVHVEEVGVEDIAFVGDFQEKFVHHKDDIHDGGWKLIEFEGVVNSWLRRCRFTDVSSAASVRQSANVSIYDASITGNIGHHAVHADASSRIFIGAIADAPAQWHTSGVTKHTMGTVLWRNSHNPNSCFECHASQPRATLFDVTDGGFMRGRCGGAVQNNPNHLNDMVLWNYNETDEAEQDFDFWPSFTPYFRFVPPIIVGFHGAGTTFKASSVAYQESIGKAVEPESLFEAQLKLRLGELPEWIVELREKVAKGDYSGALPIENQVVVSNTAELEAAVAAAKLGDQIVMLDGEYRDVKLIVNHSGTFNKKFEIKAQNPGEVIFCGDVKVEMRGDHTSLSGVYFTRGDRNPKQWKSHGVGLVAIFADYCEVANCLFFDFDMADSSYISTSLDENNRVPKYAHIHHCAFIEKRTFDQVINLNNQRKALKDPSLPKGEPMYHRISHCYFSSPKKKGNAGGGIRVGYWRNDYGRCLIDNNLFERQDSEAEIITSKSMENVYYRNTFLNCQGTMNFRHGDKQVAINNYFIGTDEKLKYGGMYIWGSDHIVGANMFRLSTTIPDRGSAAVYFNSGPEASEHALAHTILFANNTFADTQGFDLNFHTLVDRRRADFGEDKVKAPYGITFLGNGFFSEKPRTQPLINDPESTFGNHTWIDNKYYGMENGLGSEIEGLEKDPSVFMRNDDSKVYLEGFEVASHELLKENMPYTSIEGIDMDFFEAMKYGCALSPATRHSVGPTWCKEYPGDYADTGKFNREMATRKK